MITQEHLTSCGEVAISYPRMTIMKLEQVEVLSNMVSCKEYQAVPDHSHTNKNVGHLKRFCWLAL
jgi:hypothetical protein